MTEPTTEAVECRECRAIKHQLGLFVAAGHCPEHGAITSEDALIARLERAEARVKELKAAGWEAYVLLSQLRNPVSDSDYHIVTNLARALREEKKHD